MGDLVERNDLYYEKFTDVPFSGRTTGQYQGSFQNGNKQGAWLSYYQNGQLEYKGNFKKGKKEGAWVWYWSNGQLSSEGNYEDDKQFGFWNDYNKDGTVNKERTGFYKRNGEKDMTRS